MGFPKQEYWSALPSPFPGDLPNPGIKPLSPALQADSLPLSHLGSPYVKIINPQSNFKNNRHIETLCSLSKRVSIHSVDFFSYPYCVCSHVGSCQVGWESPVLSKTCSPFWTFPGRHIPVSLQPWVVMWQNSGTLEYGESVCLASNIPGEDLHVHCLPFQPDAKDPGSTQDPWKMVGSLGRSLVP